MLLTISEEQRKTIKGRKVAIPFLFFFLLKIDVIRVLILNMICHLLLLFIFDQSGLRKGVCDIQAKNCILVCFKMPNIYILGCAKTSTIMVSCEGYISKN